MPSTSILGASVDFLGMLLQVGNGASPQVFYTVANVEDFNEPLIADTVDVTNVGDLWRRRVSTLLDMGKITFKIFWVMTETTHYSGPIVNARGLRNMLFNGPSLGPFSFKIVYPDSGGSVDSFLAFVTGFKITSKVGDVFHAEIELSNDGPPSLV